MTTNTTTRGRGRPQEFDTDVVLDRVVQLFWDKGFEATSVSDIVQVTGLNKSSLYNTFGSKEALFERALDRYMAMRAAMLTQVLTEGTRGLDDIDALLQMLELEMSSGSSHRGCLAVNTSTELGFRDEHTQTSAREYRGVIREALSAALERAEALGEIPSGAGPTYVEVLVPWLLGMAVVTRAGADDVEISRHLDAGRALLASWRIAG